GRQSSLSGESPCTRANARWVRSTIQWEHDPHTSEFVVHDGLFARLSGRVERSSGAVSHSERERFPAMRSAPGEQVIPHFGTVVSIPRVVVDARENRASGGVDVCADVSSPTFGALGTGPRRNRGADSWSTPLRQAWLLSRVR